MAGLPVPIKSSPEEMILSISDLKAAGSAKLPDAAREFYNSGSTSQITVHENTAAYSKYRLRPRVLRDVSTCDPSTTVFGRRIDFPLCIAPAGLQAMAHPTGELATSQACAKRNVHMGVSSFANYSVEDIVDAAATVSSSSPSSPSVESEKKSPIAHAMQLYTLKDRAQQTRIIQRAEKAGCTAIFLTADSPVLGVRYNEHRNDFRTPAGLSFPMFHLSSTQIRAQTHDGNFVGLNSDRHAWAEEVKFLRSVTTKMEVWIKGVLTAEDVVLAREFECDGVIVSNHGGRQLDETPATIDVLRECVEAAEGKIRVHIDGGIRSGADIFKALALGAECCWVGRPAIWGLAYDGEAGVTKALDILYEEFRRCMQLTGCNSVDEITKAKLGIVRADGPLARL